MGAHACTRPWGFLWNLCVGVSTCVDMSYVGVHVHT